MLWKIWIYITSILSWIATGGVLEVEQISSIGRHYFCRGKLFFCFLKDSAMFWSCSFAAEWRRCRMVAKPPLSLQLYNFKTMGFSLYVLLIHFQIKETLAWQDGSAPGLLPSMPREPGRGRAREPGQLDPSASLRPSDRASTPSWSWRTGATTSGRWSRSGRSWRSSWGVNSDNLVISGAHWLYRTLRVLIGYICKHGRLCKKERPLCNLWYDQSCYLFEKSKNRY